MIAMPCESYLTVNIYTRRVKCAADGGKGNVNRKGNSKNYLPLDLSLGNLSKVTYKRLINEEMAFFE